MAAFGSFETDREVFATPLYTVYSARKAGDSARYAVKLFSAQRLGLDTELAGEFAPQPADLQTARLQALAIQERGAAGSRYIEPILEKGHDERGVWCATPYYDFSVNKLLIGRVALPREALQHIVCSIAQGALDFKRVCGRPHGDIQPLNVQISKGDLSQAEVVLSDPLPDGALEAADLRGIGSILLQLVRQRALDHEEITFQLPIAVSPEWTRVFGKDAEGWVSLCNRLLDPNLQQFTLDQLVQELARLTFKKQIPRKALIAAGAAALALVATAIFVGMALKRGTLLITTDPPGAEIKLEIGGTYTPYGLTPLDKTPLSIRRLPAEKYQLRAEYPGLSPQTEAVTVEGGKSRSYRFVFPCGRVTIASDPANASVELDEKPVGVTPYTSPFLAPGQRTYILRLPNYVPTNIVVLVSSNQQLNAFQASLSQVPAGNAVVEFTSRPDHVRILENGEELCTTPSPKLLRIGPHKITAQFEDWPAVSQEFEVLAGNNPPREVVLPHGAARFSVSPPEAEILLNGKPIGRGVRFKPLRPGDYLLRITNAGYHTLEQKITIAAGTTNSIVGSLEAMLGFVEFTTDPPGAGIFDTRAPSQELGRTQQGQPFSKPFQPGTYSFVAKHEGLDDVLSKPIEVAMGAKIPVVLSFSHATVQFDSDPPGADVTIMGQKAKTPYNHYQKPGPVSYHVEMEDYLPEEGATQLLASATVPILFRLRPKNVDIILRSDPPGAQFYASGALLPGRGEQYSLPWGTYPITARYPSYPALGEVATNVVVKKGARTRDEFLFSFNYGTLILTNLPEDSVLKEGGTELAVSPGPPRFAYDRPGAHSYDIYEGGQKSTNLTANLQAGLTLVLPWAGPAGETRNSLDMRLVRVRDPARPGREIWVGKYEVTQGEYLKVVGSNPSAGAQDDKLPVNKVNWQQAGLFCQRLTQMDKRPPLGAAGRYTLPTLEQWRLFAAGAGIPSAVYATNRPALVGSKGPANKLGIADVFGNVKEWLAGSDPESPSLVGGGFRTHPAMKGMGAFTNAESLRWDQIYDDLGFRVIFVPEK